MLWVGKGSLHSEERNSERLQIEQIEAEVKQEEQKLQEQKLDLQALNEQAPEVQILQEEVSQSIENLREHCDQLEQIRLATVEIHISILLSHALTLLLTSHIRVSGNQKVYKADAILAEAHDLVQDDNVLSDQTRAKKLYVTGVRAAVTGNPVNAGLNYYHAVSIEPAYRKLRRVAKFLDRRGPKMSADKERPDSWLFCTLKEETVREGELGPLDHCVISHRYDVDEESPGSGKSGQHNVEGEEMQTLDNVASAASSQMTPSQEAGARHSAPGVRKLSRSSGPNAAESAPPSDTPQPDELVHPPKSLNQATIRRKKLHRLDTSGARTSSTGPGPGSPLTPSPLRIVSVNDGTVQNEKLTKESKYTANMP